MKKAFTLAELLITLVAISILSMLLVPIMFKKFNATMLHHAKLIHQRKISQGITMLSIRSPRLSYASTEAFVKDLQNYMQILSYCNEDNLEKCWPTAEFKLSNGEVFPIGKAKGKGLFLMNDIDPEGNEALYATDNVAFTTNNGAAVLINFNTKCNPNTNNWNRTCYVALIDVNGNRGPNEIGFDLFVINGRGFKYEIQDDSETAGSAGGNTSIFDKI